MRYLNLILLMGMVSGQAMAQTPSPPAVVNITPALPTSPECVASGNCISTSDWRTFSGTVMNTDMVTQSGSTVTASNGADLQSKLNAATCGQTIKVTAQQTYVMPLGNIGPPNTSGLVLPNIPMGGSGWIYIETSDLAGLRAEHNRVFQSAGYNAVGLPYGGITGAATPAEITAQRQHMATFVTTHGAGVGTYLINQSHSDTPGCGYRFIGIEFISDANTGGTYKNNMVNTGGNISVLLNIHGDHVIIDRCYIHGVDDIKYNISNIVCNGTTCTVTADNWILQGDTVDIETASNPAVNGNHVVATVDATQHLGSITQTVGNNTANLVVTISGSTNPFLTSDTAVLIDGDNSNVNRNGIWPVTAVSGQTFTVTLGQSTNGTTNPITTGHAMTMAHSFTFASTQVISSDTGTAFDYTRPNLLGTGARQLIHDGIDIGGATYFACIDSYISEIHGSGSNESQAILGMAVNSPNLPELCIDRQSGNPLICGGPTKLVNNMLSAGGENVMWGGASLYKQAPGIVDDRSMPNQQPHDAEIRSNYFWADPNWRYMTALGSGQALYFNLKDNLEFKTMARALVLGNRLEHSWAGAGGSDNGNGFRFTVLNEQSGDNAVVNDIAFISNEILDAAVPLQEFGVTPYCGYYGGYPICGSIGVGKNHLVENNLAVLSNWESTVGQPQSPAGSQGLQDAGGTYQAEYAYNTIWWSPSVGGGSFNRGIVFNLTARAGPASSPIGLDLLSTSPGCTPSTSGCTPFGVGTGYTVGDVLSVDNCSTATPKMQVTVNTVASGAVTNVSSINWGNDCGRTATPGSSTTTCVSCAGTPSGFTINLAIFPDAHDFWLHDNVMFGPVYGDGTWQGTTVLNNFIPNPGTTGATDLNHRFSGNYFNVYTPATVQTLPNPDCNIPPTTQLSNCNLLGTNTTPNAAFVFVDKTNLDYRLTAGHTYRQPGALVDSGVDTPKLQAALGSALTGIPGTVTTVTPQSQMLGKSKIIGKGKIIP